MLHSNFPLAISLTHGSVHTSAWLFNSHPLPLMSTHLFFTSTSYSCPEIGSPVAFSGFHRYALIYDICLFLTYFTLWQTPGPSTSLQMARFPFFWWLNNTPLYICVCCIEWPVGWHHAFLRFTSLIWTYPVRPILLTQPLSSPRWLI